MSQHTCKKGWLLSPAPEDGSMVPFFVNTRSSELHLNRRNVGGWTVTFYKGEITAKKIDYASSYGLTYTKGNRYVRYVFLPYLMVNNDAFNISILMNSVPNSSWEYGNLSYSLIYSDDSKEAIAGIRICVTNVAEELEPVTFLRADDDNIKSNDEVTKFNIGISGNIYTMFSFRTTGYTLGEDYTEAGISPYVWNAILKERYYYVGNPDNKVAGVKSYELTEDIPIIEKGWESIRVDGNASIIEFYIDEFNDYSFRFLMAIDDITNIDYEEEKADPIIGTGGGSGEGISSELLEQLRSELTDKLEIEVGLRKRGDEKLRDLIATMSSYVSTVAPDTDGTVNIIWYQIVEDTEEQDGDVIIITAPQREEFEALKAQVQALSENLTVEAGIRLSADQELSNRISMVNTTDTDGNTTENSTWFQIVEDTEEHDGDVIVVTAPQREEFDSLKSQVQSLSDELATERSTRQSEVQNLNGRISAVNTTDTDGNTTENSTWFQVVEDSQDTPGDSEPLNVIVVSGVSKEELQEVKERISQLDSSLTVESAVRLEEDTKLADKDTELESLINSSSSSLQIGTDEVSGATTWLQIINEDGDESNQDTNVIDDDDPVDDEF